MEVIEYLTFVARLKGVPAGEVKQRVDQALDRCAIRDVQNMLQSKLSKGYRQRVGLAQAILHNPDVLILDEPTAGLDPKQIIETRELIRSLAGDHTIILSTHILPEVEQTCEQVIIIAKGKLVATDTVDNLTRRLRGSEAVAVEVESRDGDLDAGQVRQRLEQVPGVSRILPKEAAAGRCTFEAESLQGRSIRGELARAVVESGWNLTELRTLAFSLEEVFLQLTASEEAVAPGGEK
jgi:ABC-2 type transport system ATP-binding protein